MRDWEARFAPLLTQQLRAKRKGKVGRAWHVDETASKVHKRWHSVDRAIDRAGNRIDVLLSPKRDMDAAKRLFRQALDFAENTPQSVTADGHDSYPRATRETLGEEVRHRCSPYLNTCIKQDHAASHSALIRCAASNARSRPPASVRPSMHNGSTSVSE